MKRALFLFLCVSAYAQIPDWAEAVVNEAANVTPPTDVPAWNLLEKTTIGLDDRGRLKIERRIVRQVLREAGADYAGAFLIDGSEEGSRIRKLRGWHRRANGKVEKLDRDNVLTLGNSSVDYVSRDTLTSAFFDQVHKGSLVVFQSEQSVESMFPVESLWLMGSYPTRLRSVAVSDSSRMNLDPIHLDAWGLNYEVSGGQLIVRDIPELNDEILTPGLEAYPRVRISYFENDDAPFKSWDSTARWYFRSFRDKAWAGRSGSKPADDLTQIRATVDWLTSKISYRQHYLSSERGWLPASAAEVERLAYGDCKDMTGCFTFRLIANDLSAFPALATIGDGPRPSPEDLPFVGAFNHVIAAIPLSKSQGLAAEVEAGGQRYLLFDTTDHDTPLGFLGDAFRNRRVMICTPEGAQWVDIPDSALEPGELRVELTGNLDGNFTVNGRLKIIEMGGAEFLRATYRTGSPRDLELRVRSVLDLPGLASLQLQNISHDEASGFTIDYNVIWPGFLYRYGDGFSLPKAVIGGTRRASTEPGKARQAPVFIRRLSPVIWQLKVATPDAFKPRSGSFELSEGGFKLKWACSEGSTIDLTLESSRDAMFFAMDQREEGVQLWEKYREQFEDYLINVALLYKQ